VNVWGDKSCRPCCPPPNVAGIPPRFPPKRHENRVGTEEKALNQPRPPASDLMRPAFPPY